MKKFTREETIELVRAKKLPPEVLRPNQDEEEPEIVLARALTALSKILEKNNSDAKEDIKFLISSLSAKLVKIAEAEREVKIENIMPAQPLKWEFKIVNADGTLVRKMIAEVVE